MIEKILIGIGAGVVALLILGVFSILLAFPVMWLWNGVMPNLFVTDVVKPINFWNAWGLLILSGLLLKGSSSSNDKR